MRGVASSLLVSIALVAASAPATAQFRWRDDGTPEFTRPAPRAQWSRERDTWGLQRSPEPRGPQPWADPWPPSTAFAAPPRSPSYTPSLRVAPIDEVRDGGARPDIAPIAPPIVSFAHAYAPGSIVIDSEGRRLYYVLPGRQAYAYTIAVGREGFDWFGTETVSRKQAWPDWHPPAEMRQRDPSLPAKMTGGVNNPLGAMALYLGTTLYRIHGTNDERTLGQAGSSGCFRMMNANVLHLASLADIGTAVHVVRALEPARIGGPRVAAPASPQVAPSPAPRAGPAPRTRQDQWYEWERAPTYRPDYRRDWPYGWRW